MSSISTRTNLPRDSPAASNVSVAASESYGQVIEYIQGRLYLASYTQTPNEHTPFPFASLSSLQTPSKRSGRSSVRHPEASIPKVHPPFYFTVDDELLYNRFHADFGPLHIGHLYRFAVYLHEILGDPSNADRGIVFWSRPDSRSRANAACLLACYMILLQSWPPHLALAPIAQAEPPYMPFRDAGYSQADFGLSIQDVVYGVWRAKEQGLVSLGHGFKLDEYERYERVDQGDFNWLTPDFVALASPQHKPIQRIAESSALYSTLPKCRNDIKKSTYPGPLKNVLSHFTKRNVGLIVRLNSELYSPTFFTALGINHLDMIFDDGTCPPLPMVKNFIRISHDMINVKKQKIAVHCKAGLGRTGCLIGAYLIYRYGFTANEVIAFMRFMRPGMVVGPQQHWLHINQGYFREWWWEDLMKEKLAAALPSTPTKAAKRTTATNGQTCTPPNGSQSAKRSALSEITQNDSVMNPKVVDESLPAPTPGQPRKAHRADSRHHPYARAASGALATAAVTTTTTTTSSSAVTEEMKRSEANTRVVAEPRQQLTPTSGDGLPDDEHYDCEQEPHQQTMSRHRNVRKVTGQRDELARSSSFSQAHQSTTTTSTTVQDTRIETENYESMNELTSDIENWTARDAEDGTRSDKVGTGKPRQVSKNGGGAGNFLGVSRLRSSQGRRSGEGREVRNAGVRKSSGRVISAGGTSRTRA